MVHQIAETLGWKFDKANDQPPTPSLPILGNIEEWSTTPDTDMFVVAATPERLELIKREVAEAPKNKS